MLQEEQRFAETLEQGLKLLEEAIKDLTGNIIPGDVSFKLYDTYGFPVDLTADIARERNLEMDMAGFERQMEDQRQRARAASKFGVDQSVNITGDNYASDFMGYEKLIHTSDITALFKEGEIVNEVSKGDHAGIILESTPFYAESGGQIGDVGLLQSDSVLFTVTDTQKQGNAHVHIGVVESGTCKVGDSLKAVVESKHRNDIVRNHSATHLLHAALRLVLGNHVTQKGSLVAVDRLRFDFSHPDAITPEQLTEIEDLVYQKVLENGAVNTEEMAIEDAKKSGAMSLFGEKYGESVRVLSISDGFSTELCGGTHVRHTGDIGLFKIISESGIASGVRRIEAVTGVAAIQWVREKELKLNKIAGLLKSDHGSLELKLEQLLDKTRIQEKEIERLLSSLASNAGNDLATDAVNIGGINVLAKSLQNADPKSLRNTVDQLKNKLGTAAIILATVEGTKVSLVAGVTKDALDKVKAGELVNFVAEKVGGRGGGRADMAQAGGNDPSGLEAALNDVPSWVEQQLDV